MSSEILWQIYHKKKLNNREVTRIIVNMMQGHGVNPNQASTDLDISTERVRNWYYKGTGMTALDLLRMMKKYEFIRHAVESTT